MPEVGLFPALTAPACENARFSVVSETDPNKLVALVSEEDRAVALVVDEELAVLQPDLFEADFHIRLRDRPVEDVHMDRSSRVAFLLPNKQGAHRLAVYPLRLVP